MTTIYVILMTKRADYQALGIQGHKVEGMSYRANCSPVYCETDKSTAITDCRRLNRRDYSGMTYYPLELKLYT